MTTRTIAIVTNAALEALSATGLSLVFVSGIFPELTNEDRAGQH